MCSPWFPPSGETHLAHIHTNRMAGLNRWWEAHRHTNLFVNFKLGAEQRDHTMTSSLSIKHASCWPSAHPPKNRRPQWRCTVLHYTYNSTVLFKWTWPEAMRLNVTFQRGGGFKMIIKTFNGRKSHPSCDSHNCVKEVMRNQQQITNTQNRPTDEKAQWNTGTAPEQQNSTEHDTNSNTLCAGGSGTRQIN